MTDYEEQTPEELEAHYGPAGPVEAARSWLSLVLEDQDRRSAWPKTDSNLRLVMTQAWAWANRGHPLLAGKDAKRTAEALAEDPPRSELWPAFEETQLDEFDKAWSGWDLGTMGAASHPRLTVPDHELVLFMDTGGEVKVYTEPTLVFSLGVLMHHTDRGWLVAGFNTEADAGPPSPGWPPKG